MHCDPLWPPFARNLQPRRRCWLSTMIPKYARCCASYSRGRDFAYMWRRTAQLPYCFSSRTSRPRRSCSTWSCPASRGWGCCRASGASPAWRISPSRSCPARRTSRRTAARCSKSRSVSPRFWSSFARPAVPVLGRRPRSQRLRSPRWRDARTSTLDPTTQAYSGRPIRPAPSSSFGLATREHGDRDIGAAPRQR